MKTTKTAAVRTAALSGLDAVLTTIEVRIDTEADAGVQLEGEPVASGVETVARVERAIEALGWHRSRGRAVVRTSPAVPTNTQLHDLPIALAILVAAGELDADAVEGFVVVGALAWGPAVEPISGTLAIAELCRNRGYPLVAPAANGREAAAPGGIRLLPARDLGQVVAALRTRAAPEAVGPVSPADPERPRDLTDITGCETAKRALEIAAAGAHPLLLAGPPAAPTTGLALRMPGILPEMSMEERLIVTRIRSIGGLLPPWAGVLAARPLSAPHFSASAEALLGSMRGTPQGLPGVRARPGAATLAHCGVLCLDDVDRFDADSVEELARAAESKRTDDSRGAMPADFLIVGIITAVPDPGGLTDTQAGLQPGPRAVLERLPLPLCRTFQLAVTVEGTPLWATNTLPTGETSALVAERVQRARRAQAERYGERSALNGRVPPAVLAQRAALSRAAAATAAREARCGGRQRHMRIIRLARTIADLAGRADVSPGDVQEAARHCVSSSSGN